MGGLVVGDRLPGDAIRHEYGDDAEQSDAGIYYSILNEAIFLSRYRANYYMSALVNQKDATFDYKFAVRATRNAAAIRLLCGRGLDVDARMLLRNLYELSLLRCRLLLEPELRPEYAGANSPKAANEFWHRYIKGGRLRNFVEARVKELGIPWIGLINDGANLDQIEEVCGLTSHPTYIAKSIDTSDDFRNLDGFCISRPVYASKFSLKNAVLCLSLPGIIEYMYGPRYDAPDLIEQLNPYPPSKERIDWNEYVRRFPKVEFGLSILAFVPKQSEQMDQNTDDHRSPWARI